MGRGLKNFDRLSDNKHQIDLLSLNDFLLEKGDKLLMNFIGDNRFRRLEDITKEVFQSTYKGIFGGEVIGGLGFVGDDFPADWYNEEIIEYILNNYFFYKFNDMIKLFNKGLFRTYFFWDILIYHNVTYLKYIPKDIEDYYELVKTAFRRRVDIIEEDFFPKEYIPKLIKDFPDYAEGLEIYLSYSLKEYISREVKKVLKEYYLKRVKI